MSGAKTSIKNRIVTGLAGVGLVLANAPAMAQGVVGTGVGTPFELAFWQSIDSSSDPSLYEAYLSHFPNGTFSEIAHVKIASLRGRAPVSAPAYSTPPLTVPISPAEAPAPIGAPANVVQPAASLVRMIQPAVAVVEPTAAVAAPPVVTPAVAPAQPAAGTLGQLLAALATSQSNEASAQTAPQPATVQPAVLAAAPVAAAIAPRQAAVSFVIPPQPALYPVRPVALPPSFCSAEQRNAFHDQVYVPSVETAKRNNEAASAYLRQLQGLYDQYQLSRDPDTMNAIVVAARTYEQVAQTTFSAQGSLVREFSDLMAVPVVACAQMSQPVQVVLAK